MGDGRCNEELARGAGASAEMVFDTEGEPSFPWAAIVSIASRIGRSPETLRTLMGGSARRSDTRNARWKRASGRQWGGTGDSYDNTLRRASSGGTGRKKPGSCGHGAAGDCGNRDTALAGPVPHPAPAGADRTRPTGRARGAVRSGTAGPGRGGRTQVIDSPPTPGGPEPILIRQVWGARQKLPFPCADFGATLDEGLRAAMQVLGLNRSSLGAVPHWAME